MIMPGQERMVLTKEILLFSVAASAPIDPFYLFWALSLKDVQSQWQRVIFMQTNREDLGDRYRLIEIPFTEDLEKAMEVSEGYRRYFKGLDKLRRDFETMTKDDILFKYETGRPSFSKVAEASIEYGKKEPEED